MIVAPIRLGCALCVFLQAGNPCFQAVCCTPCGRKWKHRIVFKTIKHSSGPPLPPPATTYPNYPPHSRREQLRSLQCAVKTCDRSALEPPGLRAVNTRARRERR